MIPMTEEVEAVLDSICTLNGVKGEVRKVVLSKKDAVLYVKYKVTFEVIATDEALPALSYLEKL